MQYLKLMILAILGMAVASCGKSKAAENQAVEPLRFEERTFTEQSSTCGTDTMRCATVEVTYPVAIDGAPEVMQTFNDTVQYYVKMTLVLGEGIPEDMQAAAKGFVQSYEDFLKEEPEFVTPWELQTNGKIIYQSPQYVSVEISNYSYAGGAHPNGYLNLLTFDAQTGKKLSVTDMVSDTAQLKALAESKFREARELSPNANLNEEGFFWGGSFALPANMAMTEQGLYFVYNPYEAAAYAAGPTEFTLSKEALNDILKK